MNLLSSNASVNSLRRVFHDSFVARDLAEPLASFDVSADISEVKSFMHDRPLSVVGVRQAGIVTGIVEQDQLTDAHLADQVVPLSQALVVTTTTPIREVVSSLDETRFVLVETLGQPVGVIVRSDLEKPPMRMWLFGMVTLFEMSLTRVLADEHDGDSWTGLLAETRVNKARALQQERQRRNEQVALLDCLQLSDKGQLFAKNDALRAAYWDRSKSAILKVIKEIEALRNNLAHSQAIVAGNWNAITRLADTLDSLLRLPSRVIASSSLQPRQSRNP